MHLLYADAGKRKRAESSDSSSSESDSSSTEEEEDAPAKGSAPAKKARVDTAAAPTPAATEGGNTVFIKSLPFSMTEADVRESFKVEGEEISHVDMLTFPDTGRFRGLARITYATAAGAQKSLEWNNTELGGRTVSVEINQGRTPAPGASPRPSFGGAADTAEPSNTVFLGNLSFQVTQEAITEAFASCGTVMSVRLATDRETGQPRGFGHCEFDSIDAAKAAVAMAGTDIGGRPVRVTFAAARPPREGGDRPSFGGGRGGGRGGFGGDRGGRGGFGGGDRGRGGFGGRGGGRGGARGGFGSERKEGIKEFAGKRMAFDE